MAGGENVGRGKYEYWKSPDGRMLLSAWARDGLSLEQIAKNAGISRSTLQEWLNRFPDISDAIRGRARECARVEVENALFRRALGFTSIEETKEPKLNPATGRMEMTVTRRVEKEIPPDTGAMALLLKNWFPDRYRERQEVALERKGADFTLEITGEGTEDEN